MSSIMRGRDSQGLQGDPEWLPFSTAEDRAPFANLQILEDELPQDDADDDDEELEEEDEDVEDER